MTASKSNICPRTIGKVIITVQLFVYKRMSWKWRLYPFTVRYPMTIGYHMITFLPAQMPSWAFTTDPSTCMHLRHNWSLYPNLFIGLPGARGVLGSGWCEAYSGPTLLQSRPISGPCSRRGLSAQLDTSHLAGRVRPGFRPLFSSFLTTYLGKSVTNCMHNLFGSGQGRASFQTFYQLIKGPNLY